MEIKRMIGAAARCLKRYEMPARTPTEGAPTMDVRRMTKEDASRFATKEATEIARERGISFETAYRNLLDANMPLKEAVAGIGTVSEHDRLVRKYQQTGETEEEARRLAGTDPRAAYRHVDQVAAMKIKQARAQGRTITLSEARQAAIADDPKLAERAGLLAPRGTVPTEGSEQMAAFYHGETVPEAVMKRYAAGGGVDETTHAAMRELSVEALVRRLAASVLHRGQAWPDHAERAFADAWYATNFPPPLPTPGAGPATIPGSRPGSSDKLDAYNQRRQATVESVMDQTRRLLADPAQRHTLSPMPLGN